MADMLRINGAVVPCIHSTWIQLASVVCDCYSDFTNVLNEFQEISTTMKQPFCRTFAICSGLALLFLTLISASAQQVQRNPIVVYATAHTTTPLAFRDMAPVPWHNVSKVMPEHDRAPFPHQQCARSSDPELKATAG